MITKVTDDDIAKEVLRLQERDGVCSPETLVDEAADPNHPLHSLFTWDDTDAAAKWRVYQARKVIGRVRIVRHGYVPLEVAMSDADMRTQVIADAKSLLRGCRRRLAGIQASQAVTHLDNAISALDDTHTDSA